MGRLLVMVLAVILIAAIVAALGGCIWLVNRAASHVVEQLGWGPEATPALVLATCFFSVLAALILMSALTRPPVPPGHCRNCGYDLTGNKSGRCPECGAEFDVFGVCEKCARCVRLSARLRGTVQTCPYCGNKSMVPFTNDPAAQADEDASSECD